MNDQNDEPTSSAASAAKSSMRIYILLGVLVLVGGALALTLPAKGKWNAAQESAQAALEAGEGEPAESLMKAIGVSPMVKEDKEGLTQVYRWAGGIKTYELKLKFKKLYDDKQGIYGFPTEIIASSKPFFMTESLEGYAEAHEKTGSTYAKLAELKVEDPFSKSGAPGGGASGEGAGQRPDTSGTKGGRGPGEGRPSGGRQGGGFGRSSGPPEELKLTEDQKTKWTAASTAMREKMRGIFSSGTPREEMGAKMAEIRDEFQEGLKTFLTEEQVAQYEKIRSEPPPRGKGGGGFGGGNRPSGGGSGRSSGPPEELKLTDDQKTNWTAASNAMREKMRGIFSSGVPREEMGAKMTELRDEFQKELETFLTEEQSKKYQEIRSQRPERKKGGGGTGKRPSGPGQGRPSDGKR
jgi:Spy/CpxP family protein refolding chaperone